MTLYTISGGAAITGDPDALLGSCWRWVVVSGEEDRKEGWWVVNGGRFWRGLIKKQGSQFDLELDRISD